MLDHLIDFSPEVSTHQGKSVAVNKLSPADLVDAKIKTTDWLKGLGAVDTDEAVAQAEIDAARASFTGMITACLLYTSPSPRDRQKSRMPSSA